MRTADAHCTFCDLIHGAGEASICYEDSDALAFMDIQPVNSGHVLVVPRQHHESLVDTPPELAMHLFKVATQLANVIRKVTANGAVAGPPREVYFTDFVAAGPDDEVCDIAFPIS